jgi:hypothetical protein
MRLIHVTAAAALALGLAACGTSKTDRALSGAAIGGAAGFAVDKPVLGAVGGAAAGALTSPDDVNLGDPVWR